MEQHVSEVRAPRSALMKILDSYLARRIIFIHAPAGFGKTVVAQLWLDHRGQRVKTKHKIVSLDEYDNFVANFCGRFISALVGLQPDNSALRELVANPVFASAPVEFILQSLSALTEEQAHCVLVFDDLHMITNHEIHKLLFTFIRRLPQNFTVLFLSREALPDRFKEMELKNELFIVDSEHLRLTNEEIRSFFHNSGNYITREQAKEIHITTGGWVMGVRSLLLSNERSYNRMLVEQYLYNFLREHVWERWDSLHRQFMTHVSVVEELTPELCNFLTADIKELKAASTKELLAELADEKAYLSAVGPETYRFHDLFRDFLLQMLRENGEEVILKQLNKAGDYFFAKRDYHRAAIYYKRSANDDGVAKTLCQFYDSKNVSTSLMDSLRTFRLVFHEAILNKEPLLIELLIWCAFVEGHADEFEERIDEYYQLYPKISSLDKHPGRTNAMLLCLDYRLDFLRLFEIIDSIAQKGDIREATMTLTHHMPFFHRSNRDCSLLLHDISIYMAAAGEGGYGMLLSHENDVLKECVYSGLFYEQGKLEEAYEHALEACANITDFCFPEVRFCAMMILASILAATDRNTELIEVLGNIENMIEQNSAFYLSANLRAFRCRLNLADGEETVAQEWLRENSIDVFDKVSFLENYQQFTTARAYITVGNFTNAALILHGLLKLGERYRRPLDIIESHILLAIVHWKKRHNEQHIALEHLWQAIEIAYEFRYTQMFENEGAELVNILQRMQKSVAQKSDVEESLRLFIRTLYVSAVTGAKRYKGLTGGKMPESIAFTDKQKTVMRLMCDGCNRNAIATQMGLKPDAVKSHIKAVYRKLDVTHQTDAIIKIKELGILI